MRFITRSFKNQLGRLRILSYLEGGSLLFLLIVAVPLKYLANEPVLVKVMGPIHGILFLLFILQSIQVGVEQQWKFKQTIWKIWLSCFIPFGTFYIDQHILKPLTKKSDNDE